MKEHTMSLLRSWSSSQAETLSRIQNRTHESCAWGIFLCAQSSPSAEESYAALATLAALVIELSTGIAVIDAMLSKRSLATPDLGLSY